jgi:hypothetical protein
MQLRLLLQPPYKLFKKSSKLVLSSIEIDL